MRKHRARRDRFPFFFFRKGLRFGILRPLSLSFFFTKDTGLVGDRRLDPRVTRCTPYPTLSESDAWCRKRTLLTHASFPKPSVGTSFSFSSPRAVPFGRSFREEIEVEANLGRDRRIRADWIRLGKPVVCIPTVASDPSATSWGRRDPRKEELLGRCRPTY